MTKYYFSKQNDNCHIPKRSFLNVGNIFDRLKFNCTFSLTFTFHMSCWVSRLSSGSMLPVPNLLPTGRYIKPTRIKIMNSNFFKHPSKWGIVIRSNCEINQNEEATCDSSLIFFRGLKPVVYVGRCFGLLSRNDIFERDGHVQRKYTKLNPSYLICCVLTIFLFINAILLTGHNFEKFKTDKTTLVQLEGFSYAGYATSMFIIYLYQILASGKLRKLIKGFLVANQQSQLSSFTARKGVSRFPAFSVIIAVMFMTLGITENVIFDWRNLRHGASMKKSLSVLELYYEQNFTHWHVLIPEYTPLIIFLVIFIKLATWGWVYTDVVCVVLCRALWEKLWIIAEHLRWHPYDVRSGIPASERENEGQEILATLKPSDSNIRYSSSGDIPKEEYDMVAQLVDLVQEYISPLIFVCYAGNMYILIVMMFNWIGPFSNEMISDEKTIHVCFAFFQFLFRIAIVTYFAGEVHHMCLEIRRRIQMCSNSVYTSSLERLERILIANPTGISLFGTFIITRKFFVSIISFIVTTEIVLLQSYSGYFTVHVA